VKESDEWRVGGKTVEVLGPLNRDDFESGRVFVEAGAWFFDGKMGGFWGDFEVKLGVFEAILMGKWVFLTWKCVCLT
jgi:hypothetical protein